MIQPVLEDLGLGPDHLRGAWDPSPATPGHLLLEGPSASAELEQLDSLWSPDGWLLVHLPSDPGPSGLAALRNTIWPRAHVLAIYSFSSDQMQRQTLQGTTSLPGRGSGAVIAARRLEHILSPEATTQKFDLNAAGWNGAPGRPGYAHFRWMRRLVARFASAPAGGRILDFGCGAGWCGIEAALRAPGASLAAFDPSPAMVQTARDNAKQEGISDFTARVGFGEKPPFPAEGEAAFDLVISSGVISFARDFEAWMQGLKRALSPGGTLVIGDLNPDSRGMRARRETRPVVPVRELNARRHAEVRSWLEERDFRHEASAGYQLTTPVPQAMHFNETRLGGLLSLPLLAANAIATGIDRSLGHRMATHFDSWLMRFSAPDPSS